MVPLNLDSDYVSAEVARFRHEDWCPKDACIVASDNGSMTVELMPIFMQHLDKATKSHGCVLHKDERCLLLLDGHSLRNGMEWLDMVLEREREAVKSPANTTHFLQPWIKSSARGSILVCVLCETIFWNRNR